MPDWIVQGPSWFMDLPQLVVWIVFCVIVASIWSAINWIYRKFKR